MVRAAAALALLSILPTPGGRGQPDRTVEQLRLGEWKLVVAHDHFTDTVSCEIQKPPMTYRRGLLLFQLAHHEDTANAQFRAEGGSVHPVSSVAVEAANLGARFGSDNLRNPSDGVVNIPLAVLGDANHVAIRPNIGGRARSFDLTGLRQAIAAARSRGCDAIDQGPRV